MFSFTDSPVPVRDDIANVYRATWKHLAGPGATLTGYDRIRLLQAARDDDRMCLDAATHPLGELAAALYHDPGTVDGSLVSSTAEARNDASVVETIAIVSMLSAIDGTHRALGVDLEPLPEARPGAPTGNIAEGLRRRRTHVPMPQGAIPSALDLVPDDAAAYVALFGPQYMTDSEMAHDDFARSPGLDRAQMELISSRTSLINRCFY